MKSSLTFPRWLCLGFGLLAVATLGSRAWMDIQQGTTGLDRWSEDWLVQAGVMLLPSLYVVLLSLGGGMALKLGHRFIAGLLYLGVGTFLFFTSTNNIDFLANKTINKTEAEAAKVVESRDITAIQNERAIAEREETRQNLWRVYVHEKKPDAKAKAYADYTSFNDKPIPLKPLDVAPSNKGGGDVLERWTGIKARTWAEAKTLALPLGFMVFEIVLLSLAISGWPKGSRFQNPDPENSENTGGDDRFEIKRPPKVSNADALKSLRVIIGASNQVTTAPYLQTQWRCSPQTTHFRLQAWERRGIVRLEKRKGIIVVHKGDQFEAATPKMSIVKQTA